MEYSAKLTELVRRYCRLSDNDYVSDDDNTALVTAQTDSDLAREAITALAEAEAQVEMMKQILREQGVSATIVDNLRPKGSVDFSDLRSTLGWW